MPGPTVSGVGPFNLNRCEVVANPALPGMLRGWNTLATSTAAYAPAAAHTNTRHTRKSVTGSIDMEVELGHSQANQQCARRPRCTALVKPFTAALSMILKALANRSIIEWRSFLVHARTWAGCVLCSCRQAPSPTLTAKGRTVVAAVPAGPFTPMPPVVLSSTAHSTQHTPPHVTMSSHARPYHRGTFAYWRWVHLADMTCNTPDTVSGVSTTTGHSHQRLGIH
mgnify:CR=1 FL=1